VHSTAEAELRVVALAEVSVAEAAVEAEELAVVAVVVEEGPGLLGLAVVVEAGWRAHSIYSAASVDWHVVVVAVVAAAVVAAVAVVAVGLVGAAVPSFAVVERPGEPSFVVDVDTVVAAEPSAAAGESYVAFAAWACSLPSSAVAGH